MKGGDLMNGKANILKMLEDQLQYHETEALRIKNAISAYKGGVGDTDSTDNQTTEKVKWTSEIETVFKDNDNLTADEIQNILVNKGIEQAGEPKGRSAMLTTLSRMVNNKNELILTEDGQYKKRVQEKTDESSE